MDTGIGLGICSGGNSLASAISGLFAAGEQGGWWDPSDFSTMFQNSAGTTPVTAVGQPVGKILDKSGRGNHRTQATAASRPTLQQDASGFFYLSYDGVDDGMATGSVDFSATDKLTVVCGVTKLSDAAAGTIVELTVNPSGNNGGFGITAPSSVASDFGFTTRGTVTGNSRNATTFAAPISSVLSSAMDNAAGTAPTQLIPRINGVAPTLTAGSLTSAGNFASAVLFFGRRNAASNPLNGREYQMIIRGAASTATQIAQAERFVGSRMGIAL